MERHGHCFDLANIEQGIIELRTISTTRAGNPSVMAPSGEVLCFVMHDNVGSRLEDVTPAAALLAPMKPRWII
ncbi:hypothetical protein N7539_007885 [Penicillium diatomitis]|uniref:Uncharacterized protein n=1 Tax=Penicillium diatomitis TaxID=2819901 RepID=A0A9W9WUM1_9EURO|nr:uncharacterized protein N7539_007885 [Penicillium diatomitis]KAJ5475598.1 hypothetical protein N7539_007885 [Penicillium diatomitis]